MINSKKYRRKIYKTLYIKGTAFHSTAKPVNALLSEQIKIEKKRHQKARRGQNYFLSANDLSGCQYADIVSESGSSAEQKTTKTKKEKGIRQFWQHWLVKDQKESQMLLGPVQTWCPYPGTKMDVVHTRQCPELKMFINN